MKWSVGGSTVHCSYFLDHFRIVKPWAWEFWDMSLTIVFFMRRTEVPAKPEKKSERLNSNVDKILFLRTCIIFDVSFLCKFIFLKLSASECKC